MNLETEKIKNASLYLIKGMGDLYITKFLKLMYYLDFISVLETGRPVTNDTYYHLPYGPVPTFIKDNVTSLRDNIKKEQEKIMTDDAGTVYEQVSIFSDILDIKESLGTFKLFPKKEPDMSHLSIYEKGLLDDIIIEFKNISVKDLVQKTHQESPYIQTSMLDTIDYKMAFYLDRNKILPKRTYIFNAEVSQAEYFNS